MPMLRRFYDRLSKLPLEDDPGGKVWRQHRRILLLLLSQDSVIIAAQAVRMATGEGLRQLTAILAQPSLTQFDHCTRRATYLPPQTQGSGYGNNLSVQVRRGARSGRPGTTADEWTNGTFPPVSRLLSVPRRITGHYFKGRAHRDGGDYSVHSSLSS